MAIQSLTDLLAASGGGIGANVAPWSKASITTVAGGYYSLWTVAGLPGAASNPSTLNGALVTDATPGSLAVFTNPTGDIETYLGALAANANGPVTVMIYDRLWEDVFTVTTTTAQTITQPALTRWTDGVGVEAWLSIFAATGAGAATPTISYTDDQGNSGNTGTVLGYAASAPIHRQYPISLAAGDRGVRSIQSVTLGVSLSSGTAGLVLRKKLAQMTVVAGGIGVEKDAWDHGLAMLQDDSCLEIMILAGTTALLVQGYAQLVQG